LLKELGIPELITQTKETYLQLSITVGTQPNFRQQYRDKIQNTLKKNPPFLDSKAYVSQLEVMLQNLNR
jgi:predicted O-linked N-acetylglucosamine transferase (SPINDLY family)